MSKCHIVGNHMSRSNNFNDMYVPKCCCCCSYVVVFLHPLLAAVVIFALAVLQVVFLLNFRFTRMFLTWLFAVAIPTMTTGYSPTGERSIRSSVLSSFAYDRMSRPATSTVAYVGFNLLAINDVVRFCSCFGFLCYMQWLLSVPNQSQILTHLAYRANGNKL